MGNVQKQPTEYRTMTGKNNKGSPSGGNKLDAYRKTTRRLRKGEATIALDLGRKRHGCCVLNSHGGGPEKEFADRYGSTGTWFGTNGSLSKEVARLNSSTAGKNLPKSRWYSSGTLSYCWGMKTSPLPQFSSPDQSIRTPLALVEMLIPPSTKRVLIKPMARSHGIYRSGYSEKDAARRPLDPIERPHGTEEANHERK